MGATARRVRTVASLAAVARAALKPGGPSLPERAACVPRLVRATASGRYRGTTPARLAMVGAAAAYVASPLDVVPEALLPVIGLADDAMVLTWAVNAFIEETDRFLLWEGSRGDVVTDAEMWASDDPAGQDSSARVEEGSDSPAAALGRLRQAATRQVMESARRRLER